MLWLDATGINADGYPGHDFRLPRRRVRLSLGRIVLAQNMDYQPVYDYQDACLQGSNTLNGKAVVGFSNSLLDMPNLGLSRDPGIVPSFIVR